MSKILVIASYAPSLLNFRGPLLSEFVRRGYEVVTCAPDPDEPTRNRLASIGIRHRDYPLRRTGLNPIDDFGTYHALSRLIFEERPEHVLAYTVKPVVYGCLAARRYRVPRIHALITGLGTAFQGGTLNRRILNALVSVLYRAALSGCHTVFFQNSDDRTLFLDRGLVAQSRTRVVAGSGIDLEHFAQCPVPGGPPSFLLVARLIEEKGIRLYAEAARRVKCEFPESQFRLVGYLEDHPGAISRADLTEWEMSGTIQYCGDTNDVRPFLRDASIYCLPTYYREGVPRSILEALAVGRPIITTDTPGCRDTVQDGINGFLIPPCDLDKLVAAMLRFCQQPGLAQAMGPKSRTLAQRRFDVLQVNDDIIAGMGLAAKL